MSLIATAPEWPGFTPEGYRMYEKATQQIRTALASGHTYDQACKNLHGLPARAKAFISDDYLKIIVAEEHLGNGTSLENLAFTLGLSQDRLETAVMSLLHEINRAATATASAHAPMVSTLTH